MAATTARRRSASRSPAALARSRVDAGRARGCSIGRASATARGPMHSTARRTASSQPSATAVSVSSWATSRRSSRSEGDVWPPSKSPSQTRPSSSTSTDSIARCRWAIPTRCSASTCCHRSAASAVVELVLGDGTGVVAIGDVEGRAALGGPDPTDVGRPHAGLPGQGEEQDLVLDAPLQRREAHADLRGPVADAPVGPGEQLGVALLGGPEDDLVLHVVGIHERVEQRATAPAGRLDPRGVEPGAPEGGDQVLAGRDGASACRRRAAPASRSPTRSRRTAGGRATAPRRRGGGAGRGARPPTTASAATGGSATATPP